MIDSGIPLIAPDDAMRRVAGEGAVIVDVREAEELARTGKIAGALHIPLASLAARAPAELPRDRDILLYCAAGVRSAMAGRTLREIGWQRLYNLGGLASAVAAGIPLEPKVT